MSKFLRTFYGVTKIEQIINVRKNVNSKNPRFNSSNQSNDKVGRNGRRNVIKQPKVRNIDGDKNTISLF